MGPSHRILIVDDDPSVVELLSDFLTEAGYTPDTALTGREALTLISQRRLNVVLLDIRMPEIDGLEVLGRLRAAAPEIPVIMITGNDDLALARKTLEMGAFDYIAKPFDLGYVARAVATACLYKPDR
jgi:DNA-binding NtrC family response regulator